MDTTETVWLLLNYLTALIKIAVSVLCSIFIPQLVHIPVQSKFYCYPYLFSHRSSPCIFTCSVSARLGEHDTRTEVDCPRNGGPCASAAQSVGIMETKVHDLYKEKAPNQEHDIGLVRLERNIRYSDSIQPVCLPSVVAPETKQKGQPYTVIGFGRTLKDLGPRSAVKQKLIVNYVEPGTCSTKYGNLKVSIASTQMCAGGKFSQDSCDGDSGGPLMRFRDNAWVQEGIVSFGYKCGLQGWPGVYTSVAAYDIWIKNNVRA